MDNVDVYIWNNTSWITWEKFKKDNINELRTGKNFSFFFRKNDYLEEKQSVYLDPYETNLLLNINMTPIPGNLLIKTNSSDIDIFLNNSNYYVSAGDYKNYIKIQNSFMDILIYKVLTTVSKNESDFLKKIKEKIFAE